jgi:hypothetical protein
MKPRAPLAVRRDAFDDQAAAAFAADAKIAVVATIDSRNLPHLTLLTSLDACGARGLTFGQFSEGTSKDNLRRDPRAAFAVLTMDRRLWTGRATWTREARTGPEHEAYNRRPMFRYNAYFGIHTVHYLDLVRLEGPVRVRTATLAAGAVVAALAARRAGEGDGPPVLTPWAERHLASPKSLKFLAWIGDDGYPAIAPLVPCRSAGSRRLVVAMGSGDALGRQCALYALGLEMESVLVSGRLAPCRGGFGPAAATMEIDEVYNSMPPSHGVVYPRPAALAPVRMRVLEG